MTTKAELRQLFDDLVRFETVLWTTIDQRLQEEAKITLAALNLMLVVDRIPLRRVLDIAEALEITVGGASQAVDRVEKAGWCIRSANPTDRRSSIVKLTDDGQAALAHALPIFDRELERLIASPLGPAGIDQLGKQLRALRH